jgi:putative component of toxin-antitoxin plasmid stabilization module
MFEIRKTENFAKWLDGLNDIRARHAYWYELNGYRQQILGM